MTAALMSCALIAAVGYLTRRQWRCNYGPQTRVRADMGALVNAISLYYLERGAIPETLSALTNRGNRGDAYFPSAALHDPWGNPYVYTLATGRHLPDYRLASTGEDGILGTEDDIQH